MPQPRHACSPHRDLNPAHRNSATLRGGAGAVGVNDLHLTWLWGSMATPRSALPPAAFLAPRSMSGIPFDLLTWFSGAVSPLPQGSPHSGQPSGRCRPLYHRAMAVWVQVILQLCHRRPWESSGLPPRLSRASHRRLRCLGYCRAPDRPSAWQSKDGFVLVILRGARTGPLACSGGNADAGGDGSCLQGPMCTLL